MPHMLEQGVYGPDTKGADGMGWLAWSSGLSAARRDALASVAHGTYRPAPSEFPVRFVIARDQSQRVFAAKSQCFNHRMRDGTTRPAWHTHFLYDFSADYLPSELLALEAAPFWTKPGQLGLSFFQRSLQLLDEKSLRRYLSDARPHPLPESLVEQVLDHLAKGPQQRVCMTTETLGLLPSCLLTLLRLAERGRHALKIGSVSTLEGEPLKTPFVVTGAPPGARQRLQADQRFGVVDLDTGEFTVAGRSSSPPLSPPSGEIAEEASRAEIDDKGPEQTPARAPLHRSLLHRLRGGQNQAAGVPAASDSTEVPHPDPSPASLPRPRATPAELLAEVATIVGARDEAQRIDAAVGRFLAQSPARERQGEVDKIVGAVGRQEGGGDRRAMARLIGVLLAKEPKAPTFRAAETCGHIGQLFRSIEMQDRAVLLRAGFGRLTDADAELPLARTIARSFVETLQQNEGLLVDGTPEANNLQLALGVIGQSVIDDADLKLRAMRLLDWALFYQGRVPLRVLVRAVPREVERLRQARLQKPEDVLAGFEKDFNLARALDTQLKVETLLLLLAASLEQPPAAVLAAFRAHIRRRTELTDLHKFVERIAADACQLKVWGHVIAGDRADVRGKRGA